MKLKIDKLNFLLKQLQKSANENDLFSRFKSVGSIDNETHIHVVESQVLLSDKIFFLQMKYIYKYFFYLRF